MEKAGKILEFKDPFDTKEFREFRLKAISEMEEELKPVYAPLFKQLREEALESLRQFKMMDDEMKRKKEIKND